MPPLSNKYKTIKEALIAYKNFINSDSVDTSILNVDNIAEIDAICDSIISADEDFQNGCILKCYNNIHNLLEKNKFLTPIFKIYQKEQDSCFYRMRACTDEYLFSKEELFHIPFDKRRKVSNQRFSLSGYPCLYLGSSIYVCWEELNRPQIDNANIVCIKSCKPIQLIDLRIPDFIYDVSDYYRIPLIIACSVQVQDTMSPYKPEYVIPQALLHALIYMNYKKSEDPSIDGIIYYSSRLRNPQRLFSIDSLYENIVLPTIKNVDTKRRKKYKFCPVLCEMFETTDPVSLTKYRLCKDLRTGHLYSRSSIGDEYERTILFELEEYIRKLPTYKITPQSESLEDRHL